MFIKYKNKKVEKICTEMKQAIKELPTKQDAEKLISRINFIENAQNFNDIMCYLPFHCHLLRGKLKNRFALDINGRKCSYRLIIAPMSNEEKEIEPDDMFYNICNTIEIVLIEEVSNHYE